MPVWEKVLTLGYRLPRIRLAQLWRLEDSSMSASQSQPLPLPEFLPILPDPSRQTPWGADITDAHAELVSAYNSARLALNLDESDPIRLRFHLDRATGFMADLVTTLGLQENNPLPPSYIVPLAAAVGSLVEWLRYTLNGSKKR